MENLLKGLVFVMIVVALYPIFHKINKRQAEKLQVKINHLMEYAYAEGQADASRGDIRIEQVCGNTYVWTKSPWNDGKKPSSDTIVINDK
jgi:hypothetical protein